MADQDWQKKYLDDLNAKLKAQQQNATPKETPQEKKPPVPQATSQQQSLPQGQNKTPQNQNRPAHQPQKQNQNQGRNQDQNRNRNTNQVRQNQGQNQNRNQNQGQNRSNQQNQNQNRDKQQQGKRQDQRQGQGRDNRFAKDQPRRQDQRPPQRDQRNIQKPPQQVQSPKVRTLNGYISAMEDKVFTVTSERHDYVCSVQEAILRQGPLYIGDRVRFIVQNENRGLIDKYEPRQNLVMAPGSRETAQAANVNQIMLIVSVKEPVLRTDWLDRHLLVYERKGFKPTIICTKVDLAEDNGFLEQMEVYKRMGYKVLFTSSAVLSSFNEIRPVIKGRTTLFAGHVGTGKTTLVELLIEPENEKLPDNPEDYDLTIVDDYVESTRKTACVRIPEGGVLIDTPGASDYDLAGIERKDLKKYFRDFRNFNTQCSMPECNHIDEPNCKVLKAVALGEIAADRYQNYLKIYEGMNN